MKGDKLELVDEAEKVNDEHMFYVPHFVTRQKKKRLVYDASAKYEDCSLNSALYQGEDNLLRLVDVILRFSR